MSSKLVKDDARVHDPQQMIVGMLAVKYLQENGGQTIILDTKEMRELAQFTVRLEIVNPQDPANSPIKCRVISVADAIKFMQEMERSKGKVS